MPDDKGASLWGEMVIARIEKLEAANSGQVKQLLKENGFLARQLHDKNDYLEQLQSENDAQRRRILLLERQVKDHGKSIALAPDSSGPGDGFDTPGPDAAGEPGEPLPGSR